MNKGKASFYEMKRLKSFLISQSSPMVRSQVQNRANHTVTGLAVLKKCENLGVLFCAAVLIVRESQSQPSMKERSHDLKNLESDIFTSFSPFHLCQKTSTESVVALRVEISSDRCSQLCIHYCSLVSESIHVPK